MARGSRQEVLSFVTRIKFWVLVAIVEIGCHQRRLVHQRPNCGVIDIQSNIYFSVLFHPPFSRNVDCLCKCDSMPGDNWGVPRVSLFGMLRYQAILGASPQSICLFLKGPKRAFFGLWTLESRQLLSIKGIQAMPFCIPLVLFETKIEVMFDNNKLFFLGNALPLCSLGSGATNICAYNLCNSTHLRLNLVIVSNPLRGNGCEVKNKKPVGHHAAWSLARENAPKGTWWCKELHHTSVTSFVEG